MILLSFKRRMANYKDYLKKIYYSPGNPAAFAGPNKLYEIVKKEGKFKIGLGKIKQFLNNEDAYSLYKPIRRTFPRSKVVVDTIDSMWDGDLADVNNIATQNDGFRFLLVLIDIFSRFLFIVPLKTKKNQDIIEGLNRVFTTYRRKPRVLRTDKGSEFKNKFLKSWLVKQKVNVIYTQNETKANYAERVIRTIKNLMYRYFMKNRTYRYVEILQKLVESYNNRPHRSLGGLSPGSVNEDNADETRYLTYLSDRKRNKKSYNNNTKHSNKKNKKVYKFKIGDDVRISQLKHLFQRDYQQKWSSEYFKVDKRYLRGNVAVYKLKDLMNEPIQGTFYHFELQKIKATEDVLYRIEKVIKKRKRKGQRAEVLVKWEGWPKKFNSWIPNNSIQNYK